MKPQTFPTPKHLLCWGGAVLSSLKELEKNSSPAEEESALITQGGHSLAPPARGLSSAGPSRPEGLEEDGTVSALCRQCCSGSFINTYRHLLTLWKQNQDPLKGKSEPCASAPWGVFSTSPEWWRGYWALSFQRRGLCVWMALGETVVLENGDVGAHWVHFPYSRWGCHVVWIQRFSGSEDDELGAPRRVLLNAGDSQRGRPGRGGVGTEQRDCSGSWDITSFLFFKGAENWRCPSNKKQQPDGAQESRFKKKETPKGSFLQQGLWKCQKKDIAIVCYFSTVEVGSIFLKQKASKPNACETQNVMREWW